jgi:hypothetical protein
VFSEPLREDVQLRPKSSNISARMGKIFTKALSFAIAAVLLLGLSGLPQAQAQTKKSVSDQFVITVQRLMAAASLECQEPAYTNPDPTEFDRCVRGYLAMIFFISKGSNVSKGLSSEVRAVPHASGTPALSLSSSSPSLPFLGNQLIGLGFVPNATVLADITAAYDVGLRRQSDCSLDEDLTVPGATSLSDTYFTSFLSAQDYFHQLSGLTTAPDVFKNGCTDPVLGVSATGNILLLGGTADGSPITAELANTGLYATVTDFTTNKSTNTQLSNSQTAGYFSAASLRSNGTMDLVETGLTDPANQQPATAVFLGNGDGTFKPAVYYDVADTTGNVAGFTIDDVNGDGLPDIVVPTIASTSNPGVPTFTGSVTTLLGKGDGSFTKGPVSSVTWTDSLLPVTGDFNGDGKKDLLIGGTVLFGGGDGSFTTGPTNTALATALNSNVQTGAVGDLSNSGKLDMVVSQPGSVAIFTGNGDGTFKTGPVYAGLPDYEQVTITDIDGDGNPDIFLGTATGGVYTTGGYDMDLPMFQILMGRGDGTFVDSAVYQQGIYTAPGNINNNSLQMASADFNGDSKADVLVLTRSNVGTSASSLLVLPGDGKGNLGVPIASSINLAPTMLVAADMNHDQKPDAVMIGLGIDENQKISVLINQGNGTFAAEQDYTLGAAATSLAVGDFNGDGFMDVAVSEGSAGVFVLLGQSDGTLGTAKQIDPSNAVDLVAGSLTADGRTDLIVLDGGVAGGQPGSLIVYLGNADGSFTAATAPTTSAANYSVAGLGDLNHDGKLDLIVAGGVAGTNGSPGALNAYTLLGNGDGTFQAANTLALVDGAATSIALADFNKDGNLDVTLGDPSYYTEVLLGNGDGTLGEGTIALGQRPATVGTADLLGNGYPEVLVGLPNGALAVLLNSTKWTATLPPPPVQAATTTTLSASAATITVGASVTFTATVSGPSGDTTVPTGTVTFKEGATTLGTGPLSATGVVTYATTALPTGADSITAVYGGDSNFSGSTSSAVTVTVNAVPPGFALSSSGNIAVSPGATTGTGSTISVTGSGGFAGAVALTCAVSPAAASDPATCSLSPASVTISGATAQTSALTVVTTAASSAALVRPKAGGVPWYAAAGAALACVLFFGIPVRRRSWQTLLGMLILLASVSAFVVGCGGNRGSGGTGGSGGGGSTPANPGTTAGPYKVTVTGTSGSIVETVTVTVTVN